MCLAISFPTCIVFTSCSVLWTGLVHVEKTRSLLSACCRQMVSFWPWLLSLEFYHLTVGVNFTMSASQFPDPPKRLGASLPTFSLVDVMFKIVISSIACGLYAATRRERAI